ncbi:sugar lactone lactonase YvrE [Actinoplanes lutulentus]|uniref:Sugar lactone lactonase YvrE n=1 Tax=Actinoplanes lutulentus TaxID=1287878 RepID=A0A327Z1H9_9ACTN|nr:SMP-30/gluconolactonase/LRE family protein [Actinoplanes lutulentus]MBB2943333.1 sugar lactone lactonase YvrE [Actinoplanes lutulentus]RAK28392.1 sugar lactone lactonase YvrE [Actinoplanes lutulentus]
MTTRTLLPATEQTFRLGEGPVWDAHSGRLLWVDILGRAVYRGVFDDDRLVVEQRVGFADMVGAVTAAADGTLLVAEQEHLVLVRPDGTRRVGPRIVPSDQRRRLNDGKTDPAGRFLVGSLALDGNSQHEILVRLEPDGTVTSIDDDLTLSNGLAWSTDGRRLFSVDTFRRTVFVRDYDPLGARRSFVTLDDGYPDGIAMDAADHLWVAVWGAGEVRRYDPQGTCVERIAVPAPHTSSVAFAGDDLRRLVITTATDELTVDQRLQFPDSGRVFTVRVDIPGHPVPAWSGRPTF